MSSSEQQQPQAMDVAASSQQAEPQQQQQQPPPIHRESLNGSWILDKNRGQWSMNNYLSVMDVDPLAIQAHEKGELENDTIHTIQFTSDENNKTIVKIIKRSRVNNDIVVTLTIGEESVEYLKPGNRFKKILAKSNHPGHLEIHSSIQTVNGVASVTDIKNLIQEGDTNKSVMVQTLTITNDGNQKHCTTTRHFNPHVDVPVQHTQILHPELQPPQPDDSAAAATDAMQT